MPQLGVVDRISLQGAPSGHKAFSGGVYLKSLCPRSTWSSGEIKGRNSASSHVLFTVYLKGHKRSLIATKRHTNSFQCYDSSFGPWESTNTTASLKEKNQNKLNQEKVSLVYRKKKCRRPKRKRIKQANLAI